MNVIYINQKEVYRQLESGIRCPVCGDRMEAVAHQGRWFLECTSCVTVFGGFPGTALGGFVDRKEAIEAFLSAIKRDRSQK